MAWAIVEYKCHHKDCICVYGDKSERERVIESCKESPCPECESKENLAEQARLKALHGLYGTQDQIEEARKIKASILMSLDEEECNNINEISDATWWISNQKHHNLADLANKTGIGIRAARALKLAELQGTPGEVYWASEIRRNALYYEFGLISPRNRAKIIKNLGEISSASWWIKYYLLKPELVLEMVLHYPDDDRCKNVVHSRSI